jgi:tetratricopeptide (TPR) repeat protein/DNA-binding transcriptional ArsR family regulator
MAQHDFISRFSPNRTDPAVLEQIFVQRRDLLDQSVAVLRESALTDNKHHLLFVGPRSCGKTHLLALIVHRLKQQTDLADRLRIAWLNEDETSISFLDLLLRIYRALSDRYPQEFPREDLKRLYGHDPEEALNALSQNLITRIGNRTVLVLVENLDALFGQLDVSDQRTWRAFVQNHPVFATAATAQSLFAGVSDREQPFFGFFDTRHLRPLTVEEATELLQRIARLHSDSSLTEFLSSPRGRARVHAIHHLSGGNHRLYIVLSDFLTQETLDALVRPLEEMVDERLTPYYQERLRWLSPLQRKIVEFLCFRPRPVAVKVIADRLFAEHGTITSQLKKLREMGYVASSPRGRESLYELAEPLMRLSMQVRDTRDHQPLELIVDFLRVWYEREELEDRLACIAPVGPGREYLTAALAKLRPGEPDLRCQLLRQGLENVDLKLCDAAQIADLRALAEESGESGDWLNYAVACCNREGWLEAIEAFDKAARLPKASAGQVALALGGRGLALAKAGWPEEAITDCTRAIELAGTSTEQVAHALVNRGLAFGQAGRTEEAIADFTRAIELPNAAAESVAVALGSRGIAFGQVGRIEEAIADYTRTIELPGATAKYVAWALVNRGFASSQAGRIEQAIGDYTRAIELPDAPAGHVALALVMRGIALGQAGRTGEAIADFTQTIELPGAPAEHVAQARVARGVDLGRNGRTEEAITDFTRVIELAGAPVEWVAWALFYRGLAFSQAGRPEAAIVEYSRAIELPGAPTEQVARALVNRGLTYNQAGRTEEALADYRRAIELPGAEAERVAQALVNRAAALGRVGRTEEAIADCTRAIELSGAPAEQVARALVGRGFAYNQAGRTKEEIADYMRAIKLHGAPVEVTALARGCLAAASFNADQWSEGVEQLDSVLGELTAVSRPIPAITDAVVMAIFRQIGSPETWQARLAEAVTIYAEHDSLPRLGDALVRHLAQLAKSNLNNAGLDQWFASWEAATSQHAAMRLALRLLGVGIAYLKTQPRDENVLLQLPKEERTLARQALGLPSEQSE